MKSERASNWKCPECGRSFSKVKQAHSCKVVSVESHFAKAEPHLRALYSQIEAILEALGPFDVAPTKSGITMRAKRSFAAVKVQRQALRVEFLLPRVLKNSRMRKTEVLSPRLVAHHLEVRSVADLDAELRGWLKEAYALGCSGGAS
jgi:hypothetical protein